MRVLVTGAGGFIGHHLVRKLRKEGYWVRGADIVLPEFGQSDANEFYKVDLRDSLNCILACKDIDWVFNLAADMGGIGYITSKHADIAENNSLINIYMLRAAREQHVKRFLFSSSACVYPAGLQKDENIAGLREHEAIPAEPEPGYGWEKLYTEQLCQYTEKDYKLETRIVRFHNVYGPEGTYKGGKEKAPAALCRKIAEATDGETIDVWGDGQQTRSFMYVSDCTEGLLRLMKSNFNQPLNLGRDELISINDLAHLIAKIANKKLAIRNDLTKPQGVRGRNSDNSLLRFILGWEPKIDLETGLKPTYEWISKQVRTFEPA